MPRPTKQGIDYFPLDCTFDNEVEMYLLEKNADGLAVLITLWQLIYNNEGYYINNDKDLKLLIKKRINVDINEVNECINLCLCRNIFNKSLHKKYNILTSRGIQKRYFEAAKRKKEINVYKNYVIVDINTPNVNVKEEIKEKVKGKVKDKEKDNIYIKFDHLVLSREEFGKLNQNYSKEIIDETIQDLSNYRQNTKYKSMYKTLLNWLKTRDPLPKTAHRPGSIKETKSREDKIKALEKKIKSFGDLRKLDPPGQSKIKELLEKLKELEGGK